MEYTVDCRRQEGCLKECNEANDWECSCGFVGAVLTPEAIEGLATQVANDVTVSVLAKLQTVLPKLVQERVREGEPTTFNQEEVLELVAVTLTGDPSARVVDRESHEPVGGKSEPKIEIARTLPKMS